MNAAIKDILAARLEAALNQIMGGIDTLDRCADLGAERYTQSVMENTETILDRLSQTYLKYRVLSPDVQEVARHA